MKDKAFDLIRGKPILETDAAQLLKVIEIGTVATNVFLRRLHNFAVDLNWLPWPILPKKRWPKILFGIKRSVTLNEHERIIARETNPERKAFYEMCSRSCAEAQSSLRTHHQAAAHRLRQ